MVDLNGDRTPARSRVVHQVSLRVDSSLLARPEGLHAAVGESLDVAVQQAVSSSSAVLADIHPNGHTITLTPLRVTWDVPPAVVVEPHERDRVERAMEASVSTAMLRVKQPSARVQAAAAPPAGRSAPAGSPVATPTRARHDGPGGRVLVNVFVPLSPGQAEAACRDAAEAAGSAAGDLFGVIYLGTDSQLWIGAVVPPERRVDTLAIWIQDIDPLAPLDAAKARPVYADANSSFALSYAGTGSELPAVLSRMFGGRIAQSLKKARPHTNVDNLRLVDYEAGITREVQGRLNDLARTMTTGKDGPPAVLLTLTVDGAPYLLAGNSDVLGRPWAVPGVVLPLHRVGSRHEIQYRTAIGTGSGDGSGRGSRAGDGTGEGSGNEGQGARDGAGDEGSSTGSRQGGGEPQEEADQSRTPGPQARARQPGSEPAQQGFVIAEQAGAGRLFPLGPPSLFPVTQSCEPFLGEPSLTSLGPAGDRLHSMLERIAADMDMQPCEYAGAFLLDVASFLAARARAVALSASPSRGRPTAPPSGVKGNLGDLHFVPADSPQIQLMRHLASVVPLVDGRVHAYRAELAAAPDLIEGTWHKAFVSWEWRFMAKLNDAMGYGVGQVFADTSAVLFGELLATSAATIADALAHVHTTAPVFERRVLPMLARAEDLITWRDRLRAARIALVTGRGRLPTYAALPSAATPSPASGIGSPAAQGSATEQDASTRQARQAWRAAAGSFTQALSTAARDAATAPGGGRVGEVVTTDEGLRIRDDAGRLVEEEELEQRLILIRGSAEDVEPLVAHFDDLQAAVRRMRSGTDAVERELTTLLERMAGHNREISEEAAGDPHYGFTRSAIREDIPNATIDRSKYALGGIHLLAHQEIGEFFRGSPFYPLGIDAVFDSELGRKALSGALLFVGLVLVSVVCPVAGIVLGVEVAAVGLAEAYDKAHVYDALVDPTQVLSRAEVELELFAAWVGVALSFVPVGAKVMGALGRVGARAAVEGTQGLLAVETAQAVGAADSASSSAARAAAGEGATAIESAAQRVVQARGLVAGVEEEFLAHFVVELGKAELLNHVMEAVMTPVMQALGRELQTSESVGGLARALAVVTSRRAQQIQDAGTHPGPDPGPDRPGDEPQGGQR